MTVPLDPDAVLHEALALHRAGDLAAAAALYRDIIAADPAQADAWRLWGCAARASGDPAAAEFRLERAVSLAPQNVEGWASLGHARLDRARDAAAEAAFGEVLARDPTHLEAAYGLATALARQGRPEAARTLLEGVLERDPDHHRARHDLGTTLTALGDTTGALRALDAVAARCPDLAEARYNRALVRLARGDYVGGFADFEARWRVSRFPSPLRHADIPAWKGDRLAGRRLVLHAEQGLGDTLQFARFAPGVARFGGEVVLEVPRVLLRLLRTLPNAPTLRADDDPPERFDVQLPLMGLGQRLALTLGSVGMQSAYLAAEPARRQSWSGRLGPGRIVGLAWRGNPVSPADRGRSLPHAGLLAPLAAVPGIRLMALHKPAPGEIVEHPGPTGWRVTGLDFVVEHPGPDLDTGPDAFVDTAAIMDRLESVVTTDTAIAHLAGALGAPTRLLLQHVPDWRWLRERADLPWYPTLRLYRQPCRGAWAEPIGCIAADIARPTNPAASHGLVGPQASQTSRVAVSLRE